MSLAEFVDSGIFPVGLLYCESPPIEFLLEPPRGILRQLQRFRLLDGRQQFRRMAGMLFCRRQSNGNRLVAVCSCLCDLIPLAGFLSKDAVINSLRFLVSWCYSPSHRSARRNRAAPTALGPTIVLATFSNCKWYTLSELPCWKYNSARSVCIVRSFDFWVFAFCAAALCCTKNKALPSRPEALRRLRCQGRAVCVYRSEVKSLDRRSRR